MALSRVPTTAEAQGRLPVGEAGTELSNHLGFHGFWSAAVSGRRDTSRRNVNDRWNNDNQPHTDLIWSVDPAIEAILGP